MGSLKFVGVFALGLICGLTLPIMPSNSVIADGRSSGSGGSAGGIAGGSEPNCPADIAPAPAGNGVVDVDDLLMLINAWGECPSTPPPACVPSGSFVNAVNPSYNCAFGFVSFNISQWMFVQNGPNLSVTASGIPGFMSGPATSCEPGGTFTVSKFDPGSCDITYTLTGTFDSVTHFTGTFTVKFAPSGAGACFDCTNKTFNVSATKQ